MHRFLEKATNNNLKSMFVRLTAILVAIIFCASLTAQEHGHNTNVSPAQTEQTAPENHESTAAATEEIKYNPSPAVMHHIGDMHDFEMLPGMHLPLVCAPYVPGQGLKVFLSSAFHHGQKIVNGFALDHSIMRRVKDFPIQDGEIELEAIHAEGHQTAHADQAHYIGHRPITDDKGKAAEEAFVTYQGKEYLLEEASKLMKPASWYDFSITKNVFSMLFGLLVLALIFRSVTRAYKRRPDQAPTGLQNLMEIFVVFIRDDVAKPSIGPRYEKYLPFIMALFFFILINNIFGLIPFFPFGANVMGHISSTIVLAVFVFLMVNLSGNKAYWGHIFWMPNVPTFIKILFIPIEIASLFVKPFTLLIRLFANITAGHTIILTFVSLIFIFGKLGTSIGGIATGSAIAIPFVIFMNLLELLVAFLQAFIFVLLSSLYIGAAIEEHHHDDHAPAH